MRVRFLSIDFNFDIVLPEWFMTSRGNDYKTFKNLIKDGEIPEISSYKKIRDYMNQFPIDSIFLDIGAHIGLVSIPIAKTHRVISIEPVKDSVDYLKENALINNLKLTTIQAIAYDKETVLDIYIPQENDCTSLSQESAKLGGTIQCSRIPTIVIDNWIEKNLADPDKIKFIKIDVQGFEFRVLKGMTKLLSQNIERHVLLETDPNLLKNAHTTIEDIGIFFENRGFKTYSWDKDNTLFIKN